MPYTVPRGLVYRGACSFILLPQGVNFTSLTEVKLNDKYGKSAGNIDIVLVSYDDAGHLTDFGSLEVQAVYISGTISTPFNQYMADPTKNANLDWRRHKTIHAQTTSHHPVRGSHRNSSIKAESYTPGTRKWL